MPVGARHREACWCQRSTIADIRQPRPLNTTSALSFGAGLLSVPSRLIKRILEGNLIDMSELTIDYLTMSLLDETSKSPNPKRHPVTSIIEWTQFFANYTTIQIQALEVISNLLGYQHLILKASLESGNGWAVYDCCLIPSHCSYPCRHCLGMEGR